MALEMLRQPFWVQNQLIPYAGGNFVSKPLLSNSIQETSVEAWVSHKGNYSETDSAQDFSCLQTFSTTLNLSNVFFL